MKKKPDPSSEITDLRRRAEAKYIQKNVQEGITLPNVDSQRLIHELQVHQIELEMQNEELRQARAEVEAGLDRYTDLYDFAPVGYFTLGRDGTVNQVNLSGALLLGVERSYLVNRRFGLFIQNGDRAVFNLFLKKVFETRVNQVCELTLNKVKDNYRPGREYSNKQNDSEVAQVIVQIEATAAEDELTCRAVVIDITDRKRDEESLRWLLEFSHTLASTLEFQPGLILDQLREIIDYSASGIFVLEDSTLVTLAMRGMSQMEQSTPIRIPLQGQEILTRLVNDNQPICIADLWSDDPQALFLRSLLKNSAAVLLDGMRSWMWVPLAVRGRLVGGVGIAKTSKDFFTTHHAYLALSVANQAAVAMINAELYEHAQSLGVLDERQRLARELHDAINQSLFSAGLIAEVLPRLWERDQKETQRSLDDLRLLIHGAQTEMRALLAELQPSTLAKTNLSDLLHMLGNAFSGRNNIQVVVSVAEDFTLPAEVQVAYYRVGQEALFNIAKHAMASQVVINLKRDEAVVELYIHDDGRGFDPEKIAAGHFGLMMMRERAEAVGAVLTINSQRGHGTDLTIRWTRNPISKDAQ